MNGECLSPNIFKGYLRIVKCWQEIQRDCNTQVKKLRFKTKEVIPDWAGIEIQDPKKIHLIDVPPLKRQSNGILGFGMEPLSPEQKHDILKADSCFIPIIFRKKRQVYLVHLQAKALKVTVYTSNKYDDDQESSDRENKELNSIRSEGAFQSMSPAQRNQQQNSVASESIIQMISDYVVFLLQQSVPNFNLETMVLDAEAKEITTLDQPEDFLVYACFLAHKLGNNEELFNVCHPQKEVIRMQRAKMVIAFLSLLD